MSDFMQAAEYLPLTLRNAVIALPESMTTRIQEIRLRLEAPLILSAPDGEWMLKVSGHPTQNRIWKINHLHQFHVGRMLFEALRIFCTYASE